MTYLPTRYSIYITNLIGDAMLDLTNKIYSDAEEARKHLESIRWPNGPVCPHCGESENTKELQGKSHRKGLHKCYSCKGNFSVTVGTVFERSKVPLNKWILASHLMAASKKGISAHQIHRQLNVTYKTAWFMEHRLREAMKPRDNGKMGGGGGVVEVDETFIGQAKGKDKQRAGYGHKNKILSLVDRNTKQARSIVIEDTKVKTILPILKDNIAVDAYVMTDEAAHYKNLNKHFKHDRVTHFDKEYVCKLDPNIHTNTVEGFYSIFKRGMKGIYQHCSSEHIQRYITEFDFRYNHRAKLGFTDADRAEALLKGIEGRRLIYS